MTKCEVRNHTTINIHVGDNGMSSYAAYGDFPLTLYQPILRGESDTHIYIHLNEAGAIALINRLQELLAYCRGEKQ